MKTTQKNKKNSLALKFSLWRKNNKTILIYLGILASGFLFLAGCSGQFKSLKFNPQEEVGDSRSESSQPQPEEEAYATRSDDMCYDGRIFLGTDDNNRGDNIYVAGPSVIKEIHNPEQKYRMWYSGYEGSAWRVYHANSSDSNTWKKKNNEIPEEGFGGPDFGDYSPASGEYGTDGRIPLSPAPNRDKIYVANPTVLQERKVENIGEVPGAPDETSGDLSGKPEYHAWYGGYDEESVAWRIFYANSNDGLTWRKYLDQVVINIKPNSQEDTYVHNPTVVLDINKFCCSCKHNRCCELNRMYHMWYSGYDGSAWRIFYATSATGKVPWQKHGMVLDLGDEKDCDNLYVSEPTVILEKKYIPSCCGLTCMEGARVYHMWYAGYGGDSNNESCKEIGWRIFHATSIDGIHWTKNKKPVLNLGEFGKGDNIYVAGPTVISDTPLGLCGGSGPPFLMWYAGYNGSTWIVYKAKSNDGVHWEKINNSFP